VAVLELDWADHAEFRVPSSAVVDSFDLVADREPSSFLGGPGVSLVEL
jgi:hypothetical protein